MKQIVLKISLLCLMVVFLCIPINGSEDMEGYVPTLYHNDEAWYKDSMAPLLIKDGVYHIPADILEMFPEITVQIYAESNNLLVHNTKTDAYASVLYTTASAAVNGEIVENVDIFRQQGYYYIDADWIAGVCGLECTYQQDNSGNVFLRLTNGEQRRSFDELIRDYKTTGEQEEEKTESAEAVVPESTNTKRIYLVCTDTPGTQNTPANLLLKNGLPYTEFLVETSEIDKIVANASIAIGGVFAKDGTVEAAEVINQKVEDLLCRKLPLVLLSSGVKATSFGEVGYIPILPDFTVNYHTDPDVVFGEMLAYLRNNDFVILRVDADGCSQRMVILLKELLGWNENYTVAKLTDWE